MPKVVLALCNKVSITGAVVSAREREREREREKEKERERVIPGEKLLPFSHLCFSQIS